MKVTKLQSRYEVNGAAIINTGTINLSLLVKQF